VGHPPNAFKAQVKAEQKQYQKEQKQRAKGRKEEAARLKLG
jgi:hypothetical protein